MTTNEGSLIPDGEELAPVWYRSLSYRFGVATNNPEIEIYVGRILARFHLPLDPDELTSPPTPGVPPVYRLLDLGPDASSRYQLTLHHEPMLTSDRARDALHILFWNINAETLRTTGDLFLIHAGAVTTPTGGAMLLPAGSGGGKTTLVAGLIRAGFGYLSDEAAAVDPVAIEVYPFPKALSFKGDALTDLFPGVVSGDDDPFGLKRSYVLPEELGASVAGPAPPRYVVSIRYERDAPVELTPISRADAAVRLATNAAGTRIYGRRTLKILQGLVKDAACFQLVGGDLQRSVAVLEEVAAGRS